MQAISMADGVKIAVYDNRLQGQETVLLGHGWPLSHKMYEYQIERLSEQRYHVVAVDLRGFGESDAPARGYSYRQMATDLYRVVRAKQLSNFILVGFSMGGAIVLRYMNLFRGYGVKKLILLAAAAPCWTQRPGFPYGLSRESVDNLIRLAETDRPQLARQFSHEQLFACPQSEAAKNWFEDISLSASGIGTVRAAISLREEDGRADLVAVRVPTWIIRGAKDRVVPAGLTDYQHEHIPGSKLYTLENSGHGVFYDELEAFQKYFMEAIQH